MRVIDPGHIYQPEIYDGSDRDIVIAFMKREGEKYPGNVGSHPGTNCQEVLRVLINRMHYLSSQASQLGDEQSVEDDMQIIINLRACLRKLENRAARRHGRELSGSVDRRVDFENVPTCQTCGHVECAILEHGPTAVAKP